jgi:hypothetical protein
MGNPFYLAQDGHLVWLINQAHELNTADHHLPVVNMENWSHVDFVVFFGTSPLAAAVITVESCSNWVTLAGSPTTATKIPFKYHRRLTSQITDGNDVDSAAIAVTVAATGLIPTAGVDDIIYIIPIDSSQLISGHVGCRLDIVNAGGGCLATIFAICSGARYAGSANPTVLST